LDEQETTAELLAEKEVPALPAANRSPEVIFFRTLNLVIVESEIKLE
jgi:hypothetical protein